LSLIDGMRLATRAAVLRRFAALAAGSLVLGSSGPAHAFGWLSSGQLTPIEHRVALSVGPSRTTVWTSLRLEAAAGPVGVVIPAPPGASVDWSSDAWLEALEVASAPRVFPPDGSDGACPRQEPVDPFHIAGSVEHVATLGPDEVVILPDAAEVALWAATNGLVLTPELAASLEQLAGPRFISARFSPTGGVVVTPTLRVVLPGGPSALPLALTRAAPDEPSAPDLLVTTWVIGPGLAQIEGSELTDVPPASIAWLAASGTSTYAEARAEALAAAGPTAVVLECASHEALSNNVPIDDGTASIDGVITTFFERAAGYGDGLADPAPCVAQAASALASGAPVAQSCPRADLGVIDGTDDCVEATTGGETDPATLRCGDGADDLAVALSGQSPAEAWLTRHSLLIAAGSSGALLGVTFPGGTSVSPLFEAGVMDLSDCDGPTTSSSTTTTTTSTGNSGSTSMASGFPVSASSGGTSSGDSSGGGYGGYYGPYPGGCDCGGTVDTYDPGYVETDTETESDTETSGYDYQNEDDCDGDTTDTAQSSDDGCSGDTSDTGTESGYDYQNEDACSGDTTDTSSSDGCSGDSSGGGGSSSSGCASDSSGSSSDGCKSDTGSSSSASSCSVAKGRRRSPKVSLMTFCAALVLAPLRRVLRKKRARKSS
jgi:Uncharacterized protein conserved in bacteria (DUF2330)